MRPNYWIDYWNILLIPLYFLVISLVTITLKIEIISSIKKNIEGFLPGLYAMLVGAIHVCLVYNYYFSAGRDIINYFVSSRK